MRLTIFLLILMSTVVNASVDTTLTSTTFLYGTMSNGRYKVLVNEDFVDRYDTTASTVTMTYNNFGDFSSIPIGKVQIDMSHSTTSFVYKCNAASVPIPVKSIGAKNYSPAVTTSVTLSRILHATQDATTGLTTFYILGEKSSFDIYTTTSSITSLIPKNQGVTAGGGSRWSLTGNAGTNPDSNFIGTTDGQPLRIESDSFIQISSETLALNDTANSYLFLLGDLTPLGGAPSGMYMSLSKASFDVDTFRIDGSSFQIINGTQANGYVLTSDAYGLASWQYDTVGSGLYLPLAGGTMDSGSHIYFGTGLQNISQGTFDNSTGGNRGISLNCAVGYELNWQGGHLSSSYNNGTTFYPVIVDTALLINGTIQITDGTQGAGKILTSDSNGLASWQGGIIYDSLTSLTGETVTLTNNSTYIIAASGTVVSVTWSFPAGVTGDVLDIENMQVITTLNITGTGTGTITAAKITNTKSAGLKTFHNYGGNWY